MILDLLNWFLSLLVILIFAVASVTCIAGAVLTVSFVLSVVVDMIHGGSNST